MVMIITNDPGRRELLEKNFRSPCDHYVGDILFMLTFTGKVDKDERIASIKKAYSKIDIPSFEEAWKKVEELNGGTN